jgi:hypothetical protein
MLDTLTPPSDTTSSLDLLAAARRYVEGEKELEAKRPPEGELPEELKKLEAKLKKLKDEELAGLEKRALTALARFEVEARLAGQAAKVLKQTELPQRVRGMIEDALDQARGDVDELVHSIERHFDEVMDRASGWYKRRVQLFLFVIALLLAVVINGDSYVIGRQLWKDDALRSAVVAQANKAGSADAAKCPAGTGTPSQQTTDNRTPVEVAADCLGKVKQLNLPLGWGKDVPRWHSIPTPAWNAIPAKILGLLITAFALTLGAPFWFDLLGKVARLRGSGPASAGHEKKAAQARKSQASRA